MPLHKVFGIIVLVCVVGCRLAYSELSPASVNHFKVEYINNAPGSENIHLSGLVMNSMFGPALAGVRIKNKGKDVDIVVIMQYKRSSKLCIDIPIDSNTERVFWQGRLIWERK